MSDPKSPLAQLIGATRRALMLFALSVSVAHAQSAAPAGTGPAFTPTRPVTLIVPFPPGGGTDAVGRAVAERLSQLWGQQMIVDNRAGAQGNVGSAQAARQPGDGYTVLLAHQGVFTVNPHLYKDSGLDPLRDFKPVTRATQQPFVLVAHPSLKAQSLAELIALAKTEPGRISYGSSASGPQLAGEMLKSAAGIDLTHVPYKGAGPAVIDVLAGHIPLLVANPTSVAQHVRSGKLRALVLFGKDPIGVLPGTPTAAQAGVAQAGEMPEWYGFAVPASTPDATVAALNRDFRRVLDDPAVRAHFDGLGLVASSSSADEFARQIAADHARAGTLVRQAGMNKP